MPVSVLGLSGSPHRHGNTETLLDAFLEGAESAGGQVEKVILKDLDYNPCRGCNACPRRPVCREGRRHPLLTGSFCRLLAVASPIYSLGITAELKRADRPGAVHMGKEVHPEEPVITERAPPASQGHLHLHRRLSGTTSLLPPSRHHRVLQHFGFEYYDKIIANDMDRYGGSGAPDGACQGREKVTQVVLLLEKMRRGALTGQRSVL
jgi:hypothetical protein